MLTRTPKLTYTPEEAKAVKVWHLSAKTHYRMSGVKDLTLKCIAAGSIPKRDIAWYHRVEYEAVLSLESVLPWTAMFAKKINILI